MKSLKPSLLFICFWFALNATSQKPVLVMPAGHVQKISQMETSHNKQFLASIDSTNTITVWKIDEKKELLHLQEPGVSVTNIAFHPSMNILASSNSLGNITLWNVDKASIQKKIKSHAGGAFLAFTQDGKILISGFDHEIKLWDFEKGTVITTIQTEESITALAIGDTHDQLAIGTQSGEVISYGLSDYEKKWSQSLSVLIRSLSFFTEKPSIVAGTKSGDIASIDITTSQVITKKKVISGPINKILIDNGGNEIIIAGNDPANYLMFLNATSLDDITSNKTKWSSTPKDKFGLYSLAWEDESNSVVLIGDHDNVIQVWDRNNRTWSSERYRGFSVPINSIDVNFTGNKLALATNLNKLLVVDLTGASQPLILEGHKGGSTGIDFHPDRDLLVSVGRKNQEINIWNLKNYEPTLSNKYEYNSKAYFTVNKNYIKSLPSELEGYNFSKKSKKNTPDGGTSFKVSKNGLDVVSMSHSALTIYSPSLRQIGKLDIPKLVDFTFSGSDILALSSENVVNIIKNNQVTRSFSIERKVDKIYGLPDGSFVVWSSSGSGSSSSGFYHNSNGQEISELSGHQNLITDVRELNGNLLTSSRDGSIKIWKLNGFSYVEAATISILKYDYVVSTPDQLFDASADIMSKLHYVKDGEILSLSQLKELYYEPDLLGKLLGFNDEPLREIVDLSSIKIYPEFDILHPKDNNDKVGIRLKDTGGGIGKVVLIINGKEVSGDLRSGGSANAELDINYDIKGHPYMKPGINKITIKAYNADGTLASEGKNIYVKSSAEAVKGVNPKLFAVIVGSADYVGEKMDLKYSAKDAHDFANALEVASINMIGKENVFIKLFSTELSSPDAQPTKSNIKKAFQDFAKQARATDYLIVYLAGHGVTLTADGNTDFFYLTSLTGEDGIKNAEVREKVAVSSTELTEMFKSVAALKQVLIVDACNSGSIDLKAREKKTMNSDQVRALEKMKDRTGLFILAGSASDAVSYESPLYGQGLLTYSLLFGMKGAALKDEQVDILSLFRFAANKVPELSADIGGVQRPEIRIPTDVESFNLGTLSHADQEKIKIKATKPVLVKSTFQDSKEYFDELNLGSILDSKFQEMSDHADAPILFVDASKFSGALVINGRYEQKEEKTKVEIRVFKDGDRKSSFSVEGNNALIIADKIMAKLMDLVDKI